MERNKVLKKILALLIVTIMVTFSALPILAAAKDSFRAAKIEDFSGEVKVTKAGGEKTFTAFKGMSLAQGDTLTTGKKSSATLFIDDDKEVTVGENSKVNMSELGGSLLTGSQQTGIKLWFGKVFSKIKKKLNVRSKFEIKTPTTVAGARGTMFFVGESDGKTDVAVLDGTVVATAYIPVEGPGDGTGGPNQPQEIATVLQANQQITIDPEVLLQHPEPELQVEQVTQESLDLLVLEAIQEDPTGINPALLQNIDQVVEQRQEEQRQEEQAQPSLTPTPTPVIVYDEEVAATPTPTTTPPHPTSPPQQPEIPSRYLETGNSFLQFLASLQGVPQGAVIDSVTSNNSAVAEVDYYEASYFYLFGKTPGTALITIIASVNGNQYQTTIRAVVSQGISEAINEYVAVENTFDDPEIPGVPGDYVSVYELNEGDEIKVYTAMEDGQLLGTGEYVGETNCAEAQVDLSQASGNIVYVSVVRGLYKLESERIAVPFPNENSGTTEKLNLSYINNMTNNYSGDDYISVDNCITGDYIRVYDSAAHGYLLGTGVCEQTSELTHVTIEGGLPDALGIVYITRTVPGAIESPRLEVGIEAPEIPNVTLEPGESSGNTKVNAVPKEENLIKVRISDTSPEVLNYVGEECPVGASELLEVGPVSINGIDSKYIEVFEVDDDGKIVAYALETMQRSHVKGLAGNIEYSILPGNEDWIKCININTQDVPEDYSYVYRMVDELEEIPLEGSTVNEGIPYTSLDPIDISEYSYILLYELDGEGKIAGYEVIMVPQIQMP